MKSWPLKVVSTAIVASTLFLTISGVSAYQQTDLPIHQFSFGSSGAGNGQFNTPYGASVDDVGNIYVIDNNNNRVQVFDSSGSYVRKFGTGGAGDGQFNFPAGLTLDASGNIYVADTYNHRIQKFDNDGNFLLKFGSEGSGDGQFSYPWKIVVLGNGDMLVVDRFNNRIQKFDSTGAFLMKFGSAGAGDGQFNGVTDINVYGSDIYVVESTNKRVQKFDSAGNFLMKFGTSGSGDGQFNSPSGMWIDADGYIYVADTVNNRIQKFDSSGNFLAKFGTAGSGAGQFTFPTDVETNAAGDLVFVADTYNHRIQVYKYDRVSPVNTLDAYANSGTLTGTAVDAMSNVTGVEYKVNSGSWTACTAGDGAFDELSEAYTCAVGVLGDGSHTLYTRATDSYTNTNTGGDIDTVSFTVDTTAPNVRITQIGQITGVPAKDSLFYYFTSQTPKIYGTSEIGSTVTFTWDGHNYSTVTNGSGKFVLTIDNPELPRERVELTYKGEDSYSNVSTTKKLTLVIGEENFPAWLLGTTSTSTEGDGAAEVEPTPTVTETPTPTVTEEPVSETTMSVQLLGADGKPLGNTEVVIAGKTYTSDAQGMITVPSSYSGKQSYSIKTDGGEVKGEFTFETGKKNVLQVKGAKKASVMWPYYLLGGVLVVGMLMALRKKA